MRMCFIGDSFVTGAYDNECLGWTGRLGIAARGRGHDVTVYNLGVRGDTSRLIAQRWRAEVESRLSALQESRFVFEFGTNDARDVAGKRQMELSETLTTARDILERAARWKPTLMIGPPPGTEAARNEAVKEVSVALAVLCRDLAVPYFDSYTRLLPSGFVANIASVDGVHPSASGYAMWAALIDMWEPWRAWVP